MRLLAPLVLVLVLVACSADTDPAPAPPAPATTAAPVIADYTVLGRELSRIGNAVVARYTLAFRGDRVMVDVILGGGGSVREQCYVALGAVLPADCR